MYPDGSIHDHERANITASRNPIFARCTHLVFIYVTQDNRPFCFIVIPLVYETFGFVNC